jgi:hypothetical protein
MPQTRCVMQKLNLSYEKVVGLISCLHSQHGGCIWCVFAQMTHLGRNNSFSKTLQDSQIEVMLNICVVYKTFSKISI